MTQMVTDIVDVYVFRRLNARVQFLLLQRRNDVPMAQTWQGFHHQISPGTSASDAARKALFDLAGLEIDRYYSADFINQFYDEARDAVVLAPVLAVTVMDQTAVNLSDEFQDAGWFDRDEATARLPFSGQRWAVRHIDEIMGISETEAEIYRFDPGRAEIEDVEVDVAGSNADLDTPAVTVAESGADLEPEAEPDETLDEPVELPSSNEDDSVPTAEEKTH